MPVPTDGPILAEVRRLVDAALDLSDAIRKTVPTVLVCITEVRLPPLEFLSSSSEATAPATPTHKRPRLAVAPPRRGLRVTCRLTCSRISIRRLLKATDVYASNPPVWERQERLPSLDPPLKGQFTSPPSPFQPSSACPSSIEAVATVPNGVWLNESAAIRSYLYATTIGAPHIALTLEVSPSLHIPASNAAPKAASSSLASFLIPLPRTTAAADSLNENLSLAPLCSPPAKPVPAGAPACAAAATAAGLERLRKGVLTSAAQSLVARELGGVEGQENVQAVFDILAKFNPPVTPRSDMHALTRPALAVTAATLRAVLAPIASEGVRALRSVDEYGMNLAVRRWIASISSSNVPKSRQSSLLTPTVTRAAARAAAAAADASSVTTSSGSAVCEGGRVCSVSVCVAAPFVLPGSLTGPVAGPVRVLRLINGSPLLCDLAPVVPSSSSAAPASAAPSGKAASAAAASGEGEASSVVTKDPALQAALTTFASILPRPPDAPAPSAAAAATSASGGISAGASESSEGNGGYLIVISLYTAAPLPPYPMRRTLTCAAPPLAAEDADAARRVAAACGADGEEPQYGSVVGLVRSVVGSACKSLRALILPEDSSDTAHSLAQAFDDAASDDEGAKSSSRKPPKDMPSPGSRGASLFYFGSGYLRLNAPIDS